MGDTDYNLKPDLDSEIVVRFLDCLNKLFLDLFAKLFAPHLIHSQRGTLSNIPFARIYIFLKPRCLTEALDINWHGELISKSPDKMLCRLELILLSYEVLTVVSR